jgi:hypothetical protein
VSSDDNVSGGSSSRALRRRSLHTTYPVRKPVVGSQPLPGATSLAKMVCFRCCCVVLLYCKTTYTCVFDRLQQPTQPRRSSHEDEPSAPLRRSPNTERRLERRISPSDSDFDDDYINNNHNSTHSNNHSHGDNRNHSNNSNNSNNNNNNALKGRRRPRRRSRHRALGDTQPLPDLPLPRGESDLPRSSSEVIVT